MSFVLLSSVEQPAEEEMKTEEEKKEMSYQQFLKWEKKVMALIKQPEPETLPRKEEAEVQEEEMTDFSVEKPENIVPQDETEDIVPQDESEEVATLQKDVTT